MKNRFKTTIFIAKFVSKVLKLLNKGSGTALPGLIAEKFSPDILKYLSKQIPISIVITGTNGKTTTQTLLKAILQSDNKKVISNKSGSNLKRGLISTLIKHCDSNGKIDADVAIYEVEEATLPKIVDDLSPNQIIVTNLFRDQLDAYGEIDRTQKFIEDALSKTPNATAILNADDPRIIQIAQNIQNAKLYYGISQEYQTHFKYEGKNNHQSDINISLAKSITINPDLTSAFMFNGTKYVLQTPGIFHIYNATASIISAKLLRVKEKNITEALKSTPPAFGRGEKISTSEGLVYQFLLVKNPAGLTLTLQLLKTLQNSQLIFMLNDNTADGKDVSWIWDAEFELLQSIRPKLVICSGTRAEDMLLRIKYALEGLIKTDTEEYFSEKYQTKVIIENDINNLHSTITKYSDNSETVYVMPTYTAMLAFRKYLLGTALNE